MKTKIKSDYLLEIKKMAKELSYAEVMNSELVTLVATDKSKSNNYKHGHEASVFTKKVHNYYLTSGQSQLIDKDVEKTMNKHSYKLCTTFLSLLSNGLSWCNEANYYFLSFGASKRPIPEIGLTSYGKRQAVENMDHVIRFTEGEIVRRWHEKEPNKFQYDARKKEVEHIIGIPPRNLKQEDDEIVAVYALIRFADGTDDVIFVDHQTIKISEEDARKFKEKKPWVDYKKKNFNENQPAEKPKEKPKDSEDLINRFRYRIAYLKRLPYIYGYKTYFDVTKVSQGMGSVEGKPLSNEEMQAEQDGGMVYENIKSGNSWEAQEAKFEEPQKIEKTEEPQNTEDNEGK